MAESLPCLPLKATWSVTRRGIATHAFIRMSLFACHMLPLAIQCMAQLQREVSTSAYGLPHMPTTPYSPGMCVLFMYSVGHRGPGLATWIHQALLPGLHKLTWIACPGLATWAAQLVCYARAT
jgi:hypothetical protein